MSESLRLTAEEARAAIDEAGVRAAQVRRNDRQLGWMLGAVLAIWLGVGVVLSVSPRQGTTLAGMAVAVLLAALLVIAVVIARRIRAYSRTGLVWFLTTYIAFYVWNAVVVLVSLGTRFWASSQSYHFGLSVAVGALPLVVGLVVLARRT